MPSSGHSRRYVANPTLTSIDISRRDFGGTLTLKKCRTHSKNIKQQPLPLQESENIPNVQAPFVAFIVLGEYILEVLGSETAFVVVCHGVATMLVLVDLVGVNAEERVR